MDTNTAFVLIVVIVFFALIVVGFLIVFQQRSKVKINGPLNTGLEIDASNEHPEKKAGISVDEATSTNGGLMAENNMGDGVSVKEVKVKDDILLTNNPRKDDEAKKDPKA